MTTTVPNIFTPGELAASAQVNENFSALAKAIDGIGTASTASDVYQTGVLESTDWTPGAVEVTGGTGEIKLTTFGGAAWVPGPVSGLVRTFTTPASYTGLKPPVLPGVGGYIMVGIELTASGAMATVSVVSGAEQVSEAEALAHSPAVSAGKIRVLDVVLKNTAGTYSKVTSVDRRTQALGKAPTLPLVKRNLASVTANSGELVAMEKAASTLITPAAVAGAWFGVYCFGTSCKVKAATGIFYGDFVLLSPNELTLTQDQHVTFECDGANWGIIAGEPLREAKYAGFKLFLKAEAEAGVEPSATRPALVSAYTTGGSATIEVGGKSAGLANGEASATLWVNPGQKWKCNLGIEASTILL